MGDATIKTVTAKELKKKHFNAYTVRKGIL